MCLCQSNYISSVCLCLASVCAVCSRRIQMCVIRSAVYKKKNSLNLSTLQLCIARPSTPHHPRASIIDTWSTTHIYVPPRELRAALKTTWYPVFPSVSHSSVGLAPFPIWRERARAERPRQRGPERQPVQLDEVCGWAAQARRRGTKQTPEGEGQSG